MAKVTEWYPQDVKPVRNGEYEAKHPWLSTTMRVLWAGSWCTPNGNPLWLQEIEWRGLKDQS